MEVLFKNGTANTKTATMLVFNHTTTSGEASANTLSIDLSADLGAIDGAVIQVVDSGNNVVTADADVTFSGATLTIADGSTYNTVAGQIIRGIVFGSLSV